MPMIPSPKRLVMVLTVLGIVVVLTILFLRPWSGNGRNVIQVSGNIELKDARIGFKIAGLVVERRVNEGEFIESGQVVARLDDSDLAQEVALRKAELQAAQANLNELESGFRTEEIAQAEANMEKAQSRLDELLAGSRPQEIAAAEASVRNAQANTSYLKTEFDRRTKLLSTNTIAQTEFDRAKTAYESALANLHEAKENLKLVREGPRKEQIDQARAALQESRQHFMLMKKGPREETIEQAGARVEQARAAFALAQIRLGYATITAPFSGLVLSENIEPGEFVAPGTPVITLGDIKNVWLRAYINQTDLGRVKPGQKVHVTTDTYPEKIYEGRVSFISSEAEFTPKNVQTQKERVKLVYRIKIDIPNPDMELKPGMPADARILIQ